MTPVALVSLPYSLSNGDPGVEWTTTRRRFGWDVCGWLGGLLEAGGVFSDGFCLALFFFPVSLGVDLGCTSIMHLTFIYNVMKIESNLYMMFTVKLGVLAQTLSTKNQT